MLNVPYYTELNALFDHNWLTKETKRKFELWHEISNILVCATSKASDQPAHARSLIRAFSSRFNILWMLSYGPNSVWRLHRLVWVNATLLEITCCDLVLCSLHNYPLVCWVILYAFLSSADFFKITFLKNFFLEYTNLGLDPFSLSFFFFFAGKGNT